MEPQKMEQVNEYVYQGVLTKMPRGLKVEISRIATAGRNRAGNGSIILTQDPHDPWVALTR